MTTCVTEGARRERLFFLLRLPPSFLASRGVAAQRSRWRALPLLNLKKKRDCTQSSENSRFSSLLVAGDTNGLRKQPFLPSPRRVPSGEEREETSVLAGRYGTKSE